jgi:outer membrane protein OmpA-like peptidoglycan-associated protein
MKMTQKGVFRPDFIDSIPADCTLEFDLMVDKPSGSWGILPVLAELENRDKPQDWRDAKNYFKLTLLTPGEDGNGMSDYDKKKNGDGEHTPGVKMTAFSDLTKPVHVAMWRQKERLRIYLNEEKTWDVPKAIDPQAKLNSFILVIELKGNWNYYMSNLRLAVGAPDTRKKILEQNKWVTHGILFDVNSDKIKPESYGTLKEMANVLKDYPDLKVKIIGHTDADGADAANLDLSKRRAASVKAMLAKEFGVDESRMETDGKGESEPIDNNTTPAGKANNRRVEFIKI